MAKCNKRQSLLISNKHKHAFADDALQWASLAQSLEQAPFTSEVIGSILATNSCEKSLSTLC